MHFTRYVLLAAAITPLIAPQVFASSTRGAFDGPYLALGIGSQSGKISNTEVSAPSLNIAFGQANSFDAHAVGQLSAGYAYSVNPHISIAATIFYQMSNERAGKTVATFYQDTTTQKLQHVMGVSVEPGIYLTNKTLAFVKLGYARADHTYTRPGFNVALSNPVSGVLYGVGAKYLVTDHIFISGDVAKYNYGHSAEETSLGGLPVRLSSNAKQTVGIVSVGYQF